jgi:hypothetical protein
MLIVLTVSSPDNQSPFIVMRHRTASLPLSTTAGSGSDADTDVDIDAGPEKVAPSLSEKLLTVLTNFLIIIPFSDTLVILSEEEDWPEKSNGDSGALCLEDEEVEIDIMLNEAEDNDSLAELDILPASDLSASGCCVP